MTKSEQDLYFQKFQARRTSRVVNFQSGYDGFYNSGGQEDTNNSSIGAPTGTSEVNPDDQGIDGDVAREGMDEAWQTDVANALEHVNRAISSIGSTNRSVDDGTIDGLNLLASTMQKLTGLPSGVSIAKAVPNPEGVTREPLVVNDNANSSRPGSHGYIDVKDLENSARKVTALSSRIVNVDRL
jgi:hypothetical protein